MRLNTTAKVVMSMAGAAVLVAGLGVAEAAAMNSESDTFMVHGFTETIKPWDSISIPAMTCPEGSYLEHVDLSPGRLVPHGVQVLELQYGQAPNGAVGATIFSGPWVGVRDATGKVVSVKTGTQREGSSATNWDPANPHTIQVNLSCTTNVSKAVKH